MSITVAEVRKGIVAVLGFAAEAVALGLLTGSAAHIVTTVVGLATAVGVVVVPNASARPLLKEAVKVVDALPPMLRVPDVATGGNVAVVPAPSTPAQVIPPTPPVV